MLLNNFTYLIVNALKDSFNFSNNSTATPRFKVTNGDLYIYDGSSTNNYKNIPYNIGSSSIGLLPTKFYETAPGNSTWTGNAYMALGDGDTPPTIDDYKLSGNLIDTVTFQAQPTLNSNTALTYSALVTNNTEQPITIKEISLVLGSASLSASNGFAALLTRDVLPTPVTLNTGDSKTFSITIDFRSLTDSTVNV